MTTRRLAAILAADVVGFSALMGQDEEGTLARIKSLRREVIEPKVAEHHGRVFKITGDGFLVEFSSPVEAVRCAVGVQEALAAQGAQEPSEGLQLRIGINLGDILIEEDGDVYGDGVNVAARLEQLAEPGGICISGKIYEEVRDKLPYAFEDRGEQRVKNIARPIRAYALAGTRPRGQMDAKPLPLSVRPSIAVLPFTNMSGDSEQEYFADGVVEDIITALSRVRWFFVIARNSSFTYKGKAVDVRQVGRELGVRYVLEGSIRKAGNRVRITGQLIEAATGHHVWADKFDGELLDLFELQDQVTEAVAGAIEPSIQKAEIARSESKPTENLDAYDLYLRAFALLWGMTREKSEVALKLLRSAYELDPDFSLAKSLAAHVHIIRKGQVWSEPGDIEEGHRLALEAAANSHDDPMVLRSAGQAVSYLGQDFEYGVNLVSRALSISPNTAQVLNGAAWTFNYMCTKDFALRAIDCFNRALRLSPLDMEKAAMISGLSMSHFILEDYEAMLATAAQSAHEMPRWVTAHRFAAAAAALLGHSGEAKRWGSQLMALAPGYRLSKARLILGWRDAAVMDRYLSALRNAGVPE
jgi:adenylate cyclase